MNEIISRRQCTKRKRVMGSRVFEGLPQCVAREGLSVGALAELSSARGEVAMQDWRHRAPGPGGQNQDWELGESRANWT